MATMKYIGARYMPKFMGTYDAATAYEALSVVDNGAGTTYVSNKPVPAGTALTDTEYWSVYGASSGAILDLQNRMGTAENDITGLDNRLDTAESDISTLKTDYTNLIPDLEGVKWDIIVDINGTGDYTSLADAVSAASAGDKILVKNGVYNGEYVNARGKNLTIIGERAGGVFIQNDYDDYTRPPIETDGGYIANIMFRSTGTGGLQPAYGMHLDFNGLANNTAIFYNCTFESASHNGVGMGTRTNCVILFIKCIITSIAGNAFFLHGSTNEGQGITNQNVKLYECDIVGYGRCLLLGKTGTAGNIAYLTCHGCTLKSSQYPKLGQIAWTGTDAGNVEILAGSGNSNPYLNAPNYAGNQTVLVGRWDNNPIKRYYMSGSITANTQVALSLPTDVSFIITMNGIINETASQRTYPLGVTGDLNHKHEAFVASNILFIDCDVDGTYAIEIVYYSNNTATI